MWLGFWAVFLLCTLLRVPAAQFSDTLHVQFKAGAEPWNIVLHRNPDLFAAAYSEITKNALDGSLTQKQLPNHCHYTGNVAGHPESFVAISTCLSSVNEKHVSASASPISSFSGLIVHQGRFLSLDPVAQAFHTSTTGSSANHFTVTYGTNAHATLSAHPVLHTLTAVDAGDEVRRCGLHDDELAARVSPRVTTVPSDATVSAQHMRTQTTAKKHIEMLVVNDYFRHQLIEDVELHTAATMNVVNTLFTRGAFSPVINVHLSAQITLLSDEFPVDKCATCDDNQVDHSTLLTHFNAWRSDDANVVNVAHDVGHLFSGRRFLNGAVGYANVGVVCNPAYASGIEQGTADVSVAYLGLIAAHELAHGLSLLHDGGGSGQTACAATPYTIMSPSPFNPTYDNHADASTTTVSSAYTWSACAIEQANDYTQSALCLDNDPGRLWERDAVCGNGIVEAGEQCDCGAADCIGLDPCCDGATCTFRAGAVCSELDPCCDSCQLSQAGKVCRAAASVCDVTEKCTGTSAQCPYNLVVDDGTSCSSTVGGQSVTGACWDGHCATADEQCATVSTGYVACPFDTANSQLNNAYCSQLLCRPEGGGSCTPFSISGSTLAVPEGVPCRTGYHCNKGQCVATAVGPRFSWTTTAWVPASCQGQLCGTTLNRNISGCVSSDLPAGSLIPWEACPDPRPDTVQYCALCNKCEALAAPPHGTVSSTVPGNLNDQRTFRCNAGYNLTGPGTVVCNGTSQWAPAVPTCVSISSSDASVSPSSSDSKSSSNILSASFWTPTIIASVAGGAAVLLGCSICACCYCNQRKRSGRSSRSYQKDSRHGSRPTTASSRPRYLNEEQELSISHTERTGRRHKKASVAFADEHPETRTNTFMASGQQSAGTRFTLTEAERAALSEREAALGTKEAEGEDSDVSIPVQPSPRANVPGYTTARATGSAAEVPPSQQGQRDVRTMRFQTVTIAHPPLPGEPKGSAGQGHCVVCGRTADITCSKTRAGLCSESCRKKHLERSGLVPGIDVMKAQEEQLAALPSSVRETVMGILRNLPQTLAKQGITTNKSKSAGKKATNNKAVEHKQVPISETVGDSKEAATTRSFDAPSTEAVSTSPPASQGKFGSCVVCHGPSDYRCKRSKHPLCSTACKQVHYAREADAAVARAEQQQQQPGLPQGTEAVQANNSAASIQQPPELARRGSLIGPPPGYTVPSSTSASSSSSNKLPGAMGFCAVCGNSADYRVRQTNLVVCSTACKERSFAIGAAMGAGARDPDLQHGHTVNQAATGQPQLTDAGTPVLRPVQRVPSLPPLPPTQPEITAPPAVLNGSAAYWPTASPTPPQLMHYPSSFTPAHSRDPSVALSPTVGRRLTLQPLSPTSGLPSRDVSLAHTFSKPVLSPPRQFDFNPLAAPPPRPVDDRGAPPPSWQSQGNQYPQEAVGPLPVYESLSPTGAYRSLDYTTSPSWALPAETPVRRTNLAPLAPLGQQPRGPLPAVLSPPPARNPSFALRPTAGGQQQPQG